jgi:hypothetical protein
MGGTVHHHCGHVQAAGVHLHMCIGTVVEWTIVAENFVHVRGVHASDPMTFVIKYSMLQILCVPASRRAANVIVDKCNEKVTLQMSNGNEQ